MERKGCLRQSSSNFIAYDVGIYRCLSRIDDLKVKLKWATKDKKHFPFSCFKEFLKIFYHR